MKKDEDNLEELEIWEEDWTVEDEYYSDLVTHEDILAPYKLISRNRSFKNKKLHDYFLQPEMDEKLAKFVASAPDFARLILAVEWRQSVVNDKNGNLIKGPYECPWCFGVHPQDYDQLGLKPREAHRGHVDDCDRQAALKKAGIL